MLAGVPGRSASPDVYSRIQQTTAIVSAAVGEQGAAGAKPLDPPFQATSAQDALVRATGTLRALAEGHSEEAEALAADLPTYTGQCASFPPVCCHDLQALDLLTVPANEAF